MKYGLVLVSLAIAAIPSAAWAQDAQRFGHCRVDATSKVAKDTGVFQTSSSDGELSTQFADHLKASDPGLGPIKSSWCKTFPDQQTAQRNSDFFNADWSRAADLAWRPQTGPANGERRVATVPFNSPHRGKTYSGFVGATFDIAWMPIECFGELHIAYSLIEGSVRQKYPSYMIKGEQFDLDEPAPPGVTSLPLRGIVLSGPAVVGEFGDGAAGKALGFGCFSGQTKMVAKIADLYIGNTNKPTKEQIKQYMDRLDVAFSTTEVLTSTSVEAALRRGKGKVDGLAKAPDGATDTAAADRARRNAIFDEKMAEYDRAAKEREKALAEIEATKRQIDADRAANAERAKAAQAAFASQQAAYQAEMDAYRKRVEEINAMTAATPGGLDRSAVLFAARSKRTRQPSIRLRILPSGSLNQAVFMPSAT